LVPGNDEVTWFAYVAPPRGGGGPRRIWPRFQRETVYQILTSKTHNFPNFYPLHYYQYNNDVPISKLLQGVFSV